MWVDVQWVCHLPAMQWVCQPTGHADAHAIWVSNRRLPAGRLSGVLAACHLNFEWYSESALLSSSVSCATGSGVWNGVVWAGVHCGPCLGGICSWTRSCSLPLGNS